MRGLNSACIQLGKSPTDLNGSRIQSRSHVPAGRSTTESAEKDGKGVPSTVILVSVVEALLWGKAKLEMKSSKPPSWLHIQGFLQTTCTFSVSRSKAPHWRNLFLVLAMRSAWKYSKVWVNECYVNAVPLFSLLMYFKSQSEDCCELLMLILVHDYKETQTVPTPKCLQSKDKKDSSWIQRDGRT